MNPNDLKEFKELKMMYHQTVKLGILQSEFGSGCFMFVFAKKLRLAVLVISFKAGL